jgi:uncharacterized repeat protein (TIGR01451 family)
VKNLALLRKVRLSGWYFFHARNCREHPTEVGSNRKGPHQMTFLSHRNRKTRRSARGKSWGRWFESLDDRCLLDSAGLWVTQVSPAGGAGHPFDKLDIQFSEAVQDGTFSLSDISLTGPSGAITPTALNKLAADTYELDSTGLTGLANYALTIGVSVTDTSGNHLDQDQDGPSGALTKDAYVGALFSAPVTIGASQTTYDAQNLVVAGTTATIDGVHSFASLEVVDGATVTQPATDPTAEHTLQLSLDQGLWIDGSSAIDVSGKGYAEGFTLGNTSTGGATNRGGGSYGGLGWAANTNTNNVVYGDYHQPDHLGSGGGALSGGSGGAGGGLVQITAQSAQIDGSILANGADSGQDLGFGNGGGGSGGGILVQVTTLAGTGTLSADGGGGGSAGGGGRIAVYANTSTFPAANIIAIGGAPGNGAIGTVYLKENGGAGELLVDSHGKQTGMVTPLGEMPDTTFSANQLVLSGAGVVAETEHQMPIQVTDLTVSNGAVLTSPATTPTQEYSLHLTVANSLTVDASSAIDVSGKGYTAGYTLGNSTTGGATNLGGGSYGGMGAATGTNTTNTVYGDYLHPDQLGSGGGGNGGVGGGLVQITAQSAQIDGSIRSNGTNSGQDLGVADGGGGSGGGILVQVTTLAGTGTLSANGGGVGGAGSGGRIAVYASTSTFPVANITATGGASGNGAVGTVYVQTNGGAGELLLDSHGQPTGMYTPLGQATDMIFSADQLVINGAGVVATPQHQMPLQVNDVSLTQGAVLTTLATTPTQEYSLNLTVTGKLFCDAASSIDVTAKGYDAGYTLGDTAAGGATQLAGGSYGGMGAAPSPSSPDATYGNPSHPDQLGSGGGGGGYGGTGGGLVQITAQSAQIDGSIQANGTDGRSNLGFPAGGGGSGGGILVQVANLSGTGIIASNGGGVGGGGGGGRIAVYAASSSFPRANITANGGSSGDGNGANGSVVVASAPAYVWEDQRTLFHGTQLLQWADLAANATLPTVDITVSGAGNSTTVASAQPAISSFAWNTTKIPDGRYQLTAVFRDATAQVVGSVSRYILVNNSVVWHSGAITSVETWAAGTVHVVEAPVVVPSGVTLTIEPGAIVKFAQGAGLSIDDGGTLNAPATSTQPIILTSLADDSAGGDTNLDGSLSVPEPGDWKDLNATAAAQANVSSFVEIRYAQLVHSGSLTTDETWSGTFVHVIAGNVEVPSGVTLTILPGAVVKFDSLQTMTIDVGGTLVAQGTVAQPITFTSIRDDSVGGDTNGDGNASTPAAGDWSQILNRGAATFDHTQVLYGSGVGSTGVTSGAIHNDGGTVTFADSLLAQAFYDGLDTVGGTLVVTNSVFTGAQRGLVSTFSGGNVSVVNCTFDNNGIGLLAHAGGSFTLTNSIVTDSLQVGVASDSGTQQVKFCDVYNTAAGAANYGGMPDPTGTNGDISADPKYVDAANGNYRLGYLSPAIDAADGAVAPASDQLGDPRYNDPRTTVKTGVPDANGNYPDIGAFEFVESAFSPIDLAAKNVNGQGSVVAGQTATITWTDINLGSASAQGAWHDAINLVLNPGANQTVIPAGEVLVANSILGPGQSLDESAQVFVPGGLPANYYWQVVVNSRGDVFEGQNQGNNALSAATTSLSLPALPVDGTVINDAFAAAGQTVWYQVTPTSGQDLLITLNDQSAAGSIELYAAQTYVPTPSSFDVKSQQYNSPEPTLLIANPQPGKPYFVIAYARTLDTASVPYKLSAATPQFSLTSVSPGVIGNDGPVTLEITGGQLASSDVFQLVGVGGTFTATQVQVQDSSTVFATFNLHGAAAGSYSLVATASGQAPVTLTDAVQAEPTLAPVLSLQLLVPHAFRQGRIFDGTVTYENIGNVDMTAPLLILSTGGVAGLRIGNSGAFSNSDLVMMGASAFGPAGLLRPGFQFSIPFSVLCTSSGPILKEVDYKLATDTDAVDYTSLAAQMRPPGVPNAQWNAFWIEFQQQAGPTWGGVVQLLANKDTELGLQQAASGHTVAFGQPGSIASAAAVMTQLANDDFNLAGLPPGIFTPAPPDPPIRHHGPQEMDVLDTSKDPNDLSTTGYGPLGFIAPGDPITYRIDFQNEPTATAPAQQVVITDPLPSSLDLSTVQITGIGFNGVTLTPPVGVSNYDAMATVATDPNHPVQVHVALDPSKRVLTATMTSIDPLTGALTADPLAGFLPPDNAQQQGEGFILFTVRPVGTLLQGTISNQAQVVFDANHAIQTPSVINTIDSTPPTSSVTSLPAKTTSANFTVSWSGQDDTGGSGIASYDVYVSDENGPFTPFLVGTTDTSAVFNGVNGHTYGFYSVATDNVGNRQPTPTTAQATTTLAVDPNQLYVAAVYEAVLERQPDTSGLTYWTGQLDGGAPRGNVAALLVHSDEYYADIIITPAYSKFLGRTPDATGIAYWVDQMQHNGLTDEQLEAGFIGSAEFYTHAGGTDKTWVDAMYQDLLDRLADAAGESYWTSQLAHGAQRSDVAYGFAASLERERTRITDDYMNYLGRAPDEAGLDYWVRQFAQGQTNENLITGFIASDEYYNKHS